MAMFVDAEDRRISPIPSLLTLGNMISGFVAIVFCIQAVYRLGTNEPARAQNLMTYACLMVFLGMVFDMLDGRIARMTHSACRFGGELDSLCDAITFGLTPAILLVTLWTSVHPGHAEWWSLVVLCGVVYAACAVLRLARYNVEMDAKPKDYFSGLPSPGAAGAVASTFLFVRIDAVSRTWNWLYAWIVSSLPSVWEMPTPQVAGMYVLGIYLLLIGLLMVTGFRFVHLANLWLGGRKQFTTFVLILFCLALLIAFPYVILFLGFNGYVVVSLFFNFRSRFRHSEATLDRDMAAALSLEADPADDDDNEGVTDGDGVGGDEVSRPDSDSTVAGVSE